MFRTGSAIEMSASNCVVKRRLASMNDESWTMRAKCCQQLVSICCINVQIARPAGRAAHLLGANRGLRLVAAEIEVD
jgi:hypothetical protein